MAIFRLFWSWNEEFINVKYIGKNSKLKVIHLDIFFTKFILEMIVDGQKYIIQNSSLDLMCKSLW